MTVRNGYHVSPEVEYACSYLEKHGSVFGLNFNLGNAVSKAAEMLTVFLDEELDWEKIKSRTKAGTPLEEWT
jgi:hypothetical protein